MRDCAAEVREVLERLDQDQDLAASRIHRYLQAKGAPTKNRFPHNWCKFASLVLADRLARGQRAVEGPAVVMGEHRAMPGVFHWWTRWRGLDLDITCDQFEGGPAPIMGRKSRWHRSTFVDVRTWTVAARPLQDDLFERLLTRLVLRVEAQVPASGDARDIFVRWCGKAPIEIVGGA